MCCTHRWGRSKCSNLPRPFLPLTEAVLPGPSSGRDDKANTDWLCHHSSGAGGTTVHAQTDQDHSQLGEREEQLASLCILTLPHSLTPSQSHPLTHSHSCHSLEHPHTLTLSHPYTPTSSHSHSSPPFIRSSPQFFTFITHHILTYPPHPSLPHSITSSLPHSLPPSQDEAARVVMYENQTWLPVASLFGLIGCSIPRTLKADILTTLAAFAKSPEIAGSMWHTLENAQVRRYM